MNLITSVKQWLTKRIAEFSEKSEQKKNERQVLSVELDLDIREFDGELYIAYDNTPIVDVKHLKGGIVEELIESRKTLLLYRKKHS